LVKKRRKARPGAVAVFFDEADTGADVVSGVVDLSSGIGFSINY
jgi:hypothetical protein